MKSKIRLAIFFMASILIPIPLYAKTVSYFPFRDKVTVVPKTNTEEEAEWIASLQTKSGAIENYDSTSQTNTIEPYYANTAAMGMATDPNLLPNVHSYIQWYLNHLNEPDRYGLKGTVYTYSVRNGKENSNQDYDSADSYSATFISLIRTYYEEGGEPSFLLSNKEKIYEISRIMSNLMDTDHLTFAKKNYPIKYLMDNCEVYKGLSDMSYLCKQLFDDPIGAKNYQSEADALKSSILSKFANGDSFYVSINGDDKNAPNLNTWYPDSTSQLFPIIFGVVAPTSIQAKTAYANLNIHFPNWPELQKPDPFPWVLVGYAASMVGDEVRSRRFLDNVQSTYLSKSRQYPWYNAESGWLLLMMKNMKN